MSEISYEKPTDPRFIDRTGKVFGRLTVESFHYVKGEKRPRKYYWNCICSCGNKVSVNASKLISGHTSSCGCYQRERTSKANTRHGLSRHPIYRRIYNAITRCMNEDRKDFYLYGGRGIEIYEPWEKDIGLMVRDVLDIIGDLPTASHQFDRTNVNYGYQPDNIRWVTPEENTRNKRNTHNQAIDPVTKKSTPTYDAWRVLIFNHRDEVCEEWIYDGNPDTDNGFKAFYRDMGDKPYHGRYKRSPLKRHDESKPFCKSNCYWG